MKRFRVSVSIRAEQQLDSILRYIAEQAGPDVAIGFIRRALAYIESFDVAPERGALQADGTRRIGFERTLTIRFRVRGGDVVILGVYYRGQSLR